MFKATGTLTARAFETFMHSLALAGEIIASWPTFLRNLRRSLGLYFNELYFCGPLNVIVITIVAFLFGTVIVAISGTQFKAFGIAIYVANLVGIAAARELAPLLTAICLLFLATARFTYEIAALEKIDKQAFLSCLIRILALATVAPILSLFALYATVTGGAVVGIKTLDLQWVQFWNQIFSVVPLLDVLIGLVKAIIFGVECAFIGCFYGIICQKQHKELGKGIVLSISMGIMIIAFTDSLIEFVLHLAL